MAQTIPSEESPIKAKQAQPAAPPAAPAQKPKVASAAVPPAVKHKMPGWAWCLIGCGVLFVIVLAILIGGGWILLKKGKPFFEREIKRQEDIAHFKAGLETYKTQHNAYPDYSATSMYAVARDHREIFGAVSEHDPKGEDTRVCYTRKTPTTFLLYEVPETSPAPAACEATLPSDARDITADSAESTPGSSKESVSE